ncbi:BICD family-like cargo adapter 1 isoform X2 [Conger conger]|nr:BICD family-like cargo adapter 1 isoform X2 [Conger conger]
MGDTVPSASVMKPELKGTVEGSGLLKSEVSGSLCPFMDNALPDLVNSSASLSRCVLPGKALEAERVLTAELQVFKQSFHQQGRSGPRDEELISALKEQVARLSQKNLSLEQRLEAVCQENAGLQDSLASLHKRLVLQEEQGRQRTQQLVEAEKEVEVSRGRNQQLQEQVEQLQEEISMQESGRSEASLLSELEQSFSNMSWSQDKEQVKEEVLSVLKVLLPLTDQERALDSLRQENLDGALLLLRTTAHRLACDRAPQELNAPIVGSVRENADLIQELQDQNSKLMAENSELKTRVENSQEREVTQQAIRDRDEAIAKKNAMEKELLRCKTDMMSLNNQLLEAIHRKLELSQELEAWQDDIQVILNQQLQSQQLSETGLRKTRTNRLPFLNWSSAPELEHRRASTPCTTSSSTSEKTQAPWKGWLKRVKMGQEGL